MNFKTNDKVFAKVKGYSPWPAKILNYNKNVKKYNVEFYGTKETALIKVEELHYFITNKANFCENSKRKDFLEALKEIEKEVKQAGTDGNDIHSNDLVKPKEKTKLFGKRGRKRKLSINSENSSSHKKNADKTNESIISDGENLETSTIGQNTEEGSNVEEEESDLSSSKFTISSRSGRKIKAKQRYSTEEESITEKTKKVAKSNLNATNDESKSLKSVEECAVLIDITPDEEIDNNTEKEKEKIIDKENNSVEIDDKTSEKGEKPFILIPAEHLEILVKYASIVKEKEDIFTKREVEDLNTEENKVVVVKLPTEEYIGILFNNEKMPEFKSEFERSVYDELEANRVLDLKSQLEQGTLKYDVNDVRLVSLDKEIIENDSSSIEESLNRKKSKLKWLKAESKLLNCDCEIKAALGLEKAEPKVAYEYLNQLLELYVEPLMLKKQPQIFEVSKRLQGYVGNIHEWNMTREELIEFQDDAKKIRLKADLVFERFCSIMKDVMPSAKDLYKAAFWDAFVEEIDKFKQETAHLKENEVFVLYSEPNSRRTIIDNLYEEREQMSTTAKAAKKSIILDISNHTNVM